ncbi:MAG TPA: hypothetical protein VMR20_05140 [Verrucomicrobiae bacterium]|jgi:hypothetical protein|nr:hypothetical protein [Verrucomicrobiae bacterium]
MPAYEIYVGCNECKREHTILMRIHLNEGPDEKQSIAEFFRGKMMPPQVASLLGHKALCLRTGRTFKAEKNEQIFLVPPNFKNLPSTQ